MTTARPGGYEGRKDKPMCQDCGHCKWFISIVMTDDTPVQGDGMCITHRTGGMTVLVREKDVCPEWETLRRTSEE